MATAVVFASRGRDVACCKAALGRVGCDDIRVIQSLDDISTDTEPSFAIVEVFDPEKAKIPVAHLATDRSPGIRVLRQLGERFPACARLAISHTSCINGSNYVESLLLADWTIAVNWAEPEASALHPVDLIKSGLDRAAEHHPVLLPIRQAGASPNAQPAA